MQQNTKSGSTPAYDEASIRILEGLEPVKQRPGMYTRTESPLHIVQEVLDNAVDEAIGGFAQRIEVTLLPHNQVQIRDNGRGIPVGLHPVKNIPVIEAVFTILHAGGKFDKASGGAYSFSGGLHGVGVSVTNALSDLLEVEVIRDGARYAIGFSNGDVVKPLKKIGREDKGLSGTCVTIQPNPKYFDNPEIDVQALKALVKSKAILLPGLTTTFQDLRKTGLPPESSESEHGGKDLRELFSYTNGLEDYLREIATGEPLIPAIGGSAYIGEQETPGDAGGTSFAAGEGAAWAFSFYESGSCNGAAYVNLIHTQQGGTHVAGLRQAVFNALRMHIEHHGLLPKGVKLTADDIFKNVCYVLSAKVLDPSFENQTKDRLSSRNAVKLLEKSVQPFFEAWLNHHPVEAKIVAELCIRNAMARQRQSKVVERKKSSSVVLLPGKLSDCESADPAVTELFLVEGDSAGGSAKMGRVKDTQAILAMRGKGLNTWEKDKSEALANEEIYDISTAIGIPPHSLSDEIDFSKLRYGRICLLADADVDGYHIQVLLLTLFFKHFPQLLAKGHIYIAKPPLYRIDTEAQGKKRPAKKVYAMDEAELEQQQLHLRQEGYKSLKVGRFKGLGEMNPIELWDTTLNPDTRRLTQVMLPEPLRDTAIVGFDNLMSKSKADWRKSWLERRGHEIAES